MGARLLPRPKGKEFTGGRCWSGSSPGERRDGWEGALLCPGQGHPRSSGGVRAADAPCPGSRGGEHGAAPARPAGRVLGPAGGCAAAHAGLASDGRYGKRVQECCFCLEMLNEGQRGFQLLTQSCSVCPRSRAKRRARQLPCTQRCRGRDGASHGAPPGPARSQDADSSDSSCASSPRCRAALPCSCPAAHVPGASLTPPTRRTWPLLPCPRHCPSRAGFPWQGSPCGTLLG